MFNKYLKSNWVWISSVIDTRLYQQYSKCNKVQCPQLQWLLTILPLVQKSAFVSRQLLYAIKLCCHSHHGKYNQVQVSQHVPGTCNRYWSFMNIGHLVLSEAHTLDIYSNCCIMEFTFQNNYGILKLHTFPLTSWLSTSRSTTFPEVRMLINPFASKYS